MAIVSSGTLLRVASTAGSPGTVNTDVGEVTSVSLDGITVAEIDVSSISDSVKAFICGNRDNGTISCSLNMPTNSTGLFSYLRPATYAAGADFRKFTLRFGGNTTTGGFQLAFNGYVTAFNVSAGVDAAVTADMTIRIDGNITWTG